MIVFGSDLQQQALKQLNLSKRKYSSHLNENTFKRALTLRRGNGKCKKTTTYIRSTLHWTCVYQAETTNEWSRCSTVAVDVQWATAINLKAADETIFTAGFCCLQRGQMKQLNAARRCFELKLHDFLITLVYLMPSVFTALRVLCVSDGPKVGGEKRTMKWVLPCISLSRARASLGFF